MDNFSRKAQSICSNFQEVANGYDRSNKETASLVETFEGRLSDLEQTGSELVTRVKTLENRLEEQDRVHKEELADMSLKFDILSSISFGESICDFGYNIERLVPPMESSYEREECIVSASSEYYYTNGDPNHFAYKAFGETVGNSWGWLAVSGKIAGEWIQVRFPDTRLCNVVVVTCHNFQLFTYTPTEFLIQASNAGLDSDFTTLRKVKTSWSKAGEVQIFPVLNFKAYSRYRIRIVTAPYNYTGFGLINFGKLKKI
jgi:hypothetical protein